MKSVNPRMVIWQHEPEGEKRDSSAASAAWRKLSMEAEAQRQ
jgi:hypothetical protein